MNQSVLLIIGVVAVLFAISAAYLLGRIPYTKKWEERKYHSVLEIVENNIAYKVTLSTVDKIKLLFHKAAIKHIASGEIAKFKTWLVSKEDTLDGTYPKVYKYIYFMKGISDNTHKTVMAKIPLKYRAFVIAAETYLHGKSITAATLADVQKGVLAVSSKFLTGGDALISPMYAPSILLTAWKDIKPIYPNMSAYLSMVSTVYPNVPATTTATPQPTVVVKSTKHATKTKMAHSLVKQTSNAITDVSDDKTIPATHKEIAHAHSVVTNANDDKEIHHTKADVTKAAKTIAKVATPKVTQEIHHAAIAAHKAAAPIAKKETEAEMEKTREENAKARKQEEKVIKEAEHKVKNTLHGIGHELGKLFGHHSKGHSSVHQPIEHNAGTYVHYENWYPDGDVIGYKNTTVEECKKYCDSEDKCIAFGYEPSLKYCTINSTSRISHVGEKNEGKLDAYRKVLPPMTKTPDGTVITERVTITTMTPKVIVALVDGARVRAEATGIRPTTWGKNRDSEIGWAHIYATSREGKKYSEHMPGGDGIIELTSVLINTRILPHRTVYIIDANVSTRDGFKERTYYY